MENKNDYQIINHTRFKVSLIDRIRILFGRETKVSITVYTKNEVEVIKTEAIVEVEKFIKEKPYLMQSI